jgi:hypothetical protein
MGQTQPRCPIEEFQEIARVYDATLYKIHPNGVLNGQSTMKIISDLIYHPGMKEKVGEKFYDFVIEQINEATESSPFIISLHNKHEYKPNVREQVKKILMYPAIFYEPFLDVKIPEEKLEKVREDLHLIRFSLRVVDGKVNAVRLENAYQENPYKPFLNDYRFLIMNYLGDDIKENCKTLGSDASKLTSNSDAEHITIINSNVVHNCGEKDVLDFVDEFTSNNYPAFSVNFGNIKTTVSKDWSLFSRCYVIEVASEYLSKFIQEFNEKFKDKLKKPVNPTLHTTFAIIPRALNFF